MLLERQGNLSLTKRKVFQKQNAGSIVLSWYHGENIFRNFLTGALGQVMLKIEAFQNTHILEGDICKICTPTLSTEGVAHFGNAPFLGCYHTHNVLQTTFSVQMTTLHLLVIQVSHEDYIVPTI